MFSLTSALDSDPHTEVADVKFRASLAAQVLKLLAAAAGTGGGATPRKREFIVNFYGHLYPRDIASYFTDQFERFLNEDLSIPTIVKVLNDKLSYQEKIFCLLALYEFVIADAAHEAEIAAAREISGLLDVDVADQAFIENSFGIRSTTQAILDEANIISLRVTGDRETADVYLPIEGLDLEIYKIQNIYCVTKKDDIHSVNVEGYSLKRNISTRLSHNYFILINDYALKYHDLRVYFLNKVRPISTSLYITQKDYEPAFAEEPDEDSILRIDVNGSLMTMNVLDQFALVNHNEQRVTGEVQINLGDSIFVNGYKLNLRELFYTLNSKREITFSPDKKRYTISNDLKGDVYIHDELPDRWAAHLVTDGDSHYFECGDCPYQIFLNGRPLECGQELEHDDVIFLQGNYMRLDAENGMLRRAMFSFNRLIADNIKYDFDDGNPGLDHVSFDIEYGELVAIMGPSGCGKSTLLRMMSGFNAPDSGALTVDRYDLHRQYGLIKDLMAYVPQDDLLLSNLTVYENLYYYAKLRFPDKGEEEIDAQIDMVLNDISLFEKKNSRVGDVTDKVLSGGERKRLNIGLELLTNAEIFLLDEPTSGLSSKDSEKIIELLSNITLRGKIVVAVIHQPSSKIYKMFNKVVLLDKGGKLAYYGGTYSALEYFKRHMEKSPTREAIEIECPHCKTVQPDILLDSLEESLRDIDGSLLGKRKYSPGYWQVKYRDTAIDAWFSSVELPTTDTLPPCARMGVRERFSQFKALLSRNYVNKIRDRSNLLITFLEAPFLGAGIGFILRYSPNGDYTLYTNDLFPTFLFVAVIVTVFLSMTNSVDEIIGDSALFLRERMLNMTNTAYLGAKLLVLMPFAIVQNILFIIMGFLFVEVRELWVPYVVYMTILSYTGLSLGLFISAIPRLSSRAAQNIVPLILVPQIILGGALIEYEKMNKQLTLIDNSPVPEICQLMPSRWAYEGLIVMQESYNRYHDEHTRLVDSLKETKIAINNAETDEAKSRLEEEKDRKSDSLEEFRHEFKHDYGNKHVHDAVVLGENKYEQDRLSEHTDYVYPMFVREKMIPFTGIRLNTAYYNAIILLVMAFGINMLTLFMLNRREAMIRCMSRLTRKAKKIKGKKKPLTEE